MLGRILPLKQPTLRFELVLSHLKHPNQAAWEELVINIPDPGT
jgi:hypothetical protein